MVISGGGVVAEAVGVADAVGRGEAGCVLGLVLAGDAEGDAADDAGGAAPGNAQLGGVAGTVGMVLAGLAAGEPVVGSGEDCAAGESDPPGVMAGWLPGSAVALPGCPVSSLTAA